MKQSDLFYDVDALADVRAVHAEAESSRGAQALDGALARGCWIYGAGGYGRLVRRLLEARGRRVHGFVDRRAGVPALVASLGLPIVLPDELTPESARGATLIVALHNFAADQTPVVAWARALGFDPILIPADLPDLLGPEAESYWLTRRGHVVDHLEPIGEVADMLADDRSRETLFALARFRAGGGIDMHPPADITDQYFPRVLPPLADGARIVDGGAFTGDIWDGIARAGIAVDSWYAFEPDPANFAALVATARRVPARHTALFPCGLGDRMHQLRFASGQASSHAVAPGEGDTVVQIVALDEVLSGAAPTLIKLDVEGAEREALAGMRATLMRDRPRLAVAIYHLPQDLWEIPLMVRDLMPEAQLYVRQHGFNGFDTVLYAVD